MVCVDIALHTSLQPLGRGTKVCINSPGHITKMAPRAINSKIHLKDLLLFNWLTYLMQLGM